MDTVLHDLWFDPNSVAGDKVAECWISHGPRAGDADFDPTPGDSVRLQFCPGRPLNLGLTASCRAGHSALSIRSLAIEKASMTEAEVSLAS